MIFLRRFFSASYLALALLSSGWCWAEKNVAVIVPMEHRAMDDIVAGVKNVLQAPDYTVHIYRAHGDLNILANILNQIQYQKTDAVIAIGTTTSQMALAQLPDNYLVVCAATSLEPTREKTYVIDDTADVSDFLSRLPRLSRLGVCYSAQEKSVNEVAALKLALDQKGVVLDERMVHTIQDIPSAMASFPYKMQALLLLKDHLTVSALPIFIEGCLGRGIPLIASDESSVRNGATLALGIEEKQTGVLSGQVVQRYFEGKEQPQKILLQPFSKLYVNQEALKNQTLWTQKELESLDWSLVSIG